MTNAVIAPDASQLGRRAIEAVMKEIDCVEHAREGPIIDEFMGGALVTVVVEYTVDDDDEEAEQDEFWVHVRGDVVHVYEYPSDVYRAVADYRPNLWYRLVGAGTVPGLIAVLITITICYLAAIGQAEKVPQVIGAALTTILGFYFGRQAVPK